MFELQAGKTAMQTLEDNWDEAQNLINLLETCLEETGGKIPKNFFESYPRVFPQGCIELAILHQDASGDQKIFLLRRPIDDEYWSGQFHMPGTTLYALDDEDKMWERLLRNELNGMLTPEDFLIAFVHVTTRQERERGACQHAVYVCTLEDWAAERLGLEHFHSLRELPTNTIQHHVDMLTKLRDHLP